MLPSSILIANRGEIACRVIAACHELGIEAIAVYSAADARALHVRLADRAMPIGAASPAESYLRGDRMIEVAHTSGAAAIHPGYGFLSESAAFAEECIAAGITFIGPSPAAMRLLGNKIAAKEVAQRAGVPVLPDYRGTDSSPATLEREAAHIGFPILIKAAAGGGGRGMRVVATPAELQASAEGAAREAASAFGDATIFLERYLPRPRHIEVQVLADAHGTVLAVGERECSVQRRHQKVIEEAPSPVIDPALRQRLYAAAIMLARAADYVNAGTVEFLLDADGQFYFLEMNTRLQVEHPVTELVMGLDLVAAQIRVAAGQPLGLRQEDLRARGHALEARLYAEDPSRGFLPSTGTLLTCDLPHLPGVRIDTGVAAGDTIGFDYDPLIAKVIAHAETRQAALTRLLQALERTHVLGVTTNSIYLRRILSHHDFVAANLSTRFLEEHRHTFLPTAPSPEPLAWIAAALALVDEPEPECDGLQGVARSLWSSLGPWRHAATGRTLRLHCGEEQREVALQALGDHEWQARLDGAAYHLNSARHNGLLILRVADQTHTFSIARAAATIYLDAPTGSCAFSPAPPARNRAGGERGAGLAGLRAPMPGVVVKVLVREGQQVEERQPLLVLEAMKMEHMIEAPQAGIVARLPYSVGAQVQAGAVLAEIGG